MVILDVDPVSICSEGVLKIKLLKRVIVVNSLNPSQWLPIKILDSPIPVAIDG